MDLNAMTLEKEWQGEIHFDPQARMNPWSVGIERPNRPPYEKRWGFGTTPTAAANDAMYEHTIWPDRPQPKK
ncbi:hypothetical protein LCGC14_0735990 [marine sediment metagenome]|uniref:Uncharacterized protein n=1 Tax=marine sediment metagenome TaxID=412755 RepID=A0A0F9QSZ9_9ZZZZ